MFNNYMTLPFPSRVAEAAGTSSAVDFHSLFRGYAFAALARVAVGNDFAEGSAEAKRWERDVKLIIEETEKLSTRQGEGFYRWLPWVNIMHRRRAFRRAKHC